MNVHDSRCINLPEMIAVFAVMLMETDYNSYGATVKLQKCVQWKFGV